MIISPGRKYIFVHIPKTGGTAVSLALEGRAMADDVLIGDTPKAVNRRGRVKKMNAAGRLWKHSGLSDIEGIIDRDAFDDFFVFTLVRNPWDRIVSYYHWLRVQTWDHPAVRLAKASDFSTFLNAAETRKVLSTPYGAYMRDGAGRERDAHFIKVESLDVGLAPLWDHLGFDLGPIARTNASDRARDFRTFYSDDDAELVTELAHNDIERFSYGFSD